MLQLQNGGDSRSNRVGSLPGQGPERGNSIRETVIQQNKNMSFSSFGDKVSAKANKTSPRISHKQGHGSSHSRKSDMFLVGLIGATLMVVQALVAIAVLTNWLRKENEEMLSALHKAGIYEP
mmetsp:Transcript_15596/g.33141  ORF Transcript_15596/g.33141 Transcript_15596/m.33141 type:complete len:122 (-) Transcript_15596:63-428(-)